MGVEALIRWNHPNKGLVAPLHFIPLLEETGMIVEVGEWVLRAACEQNQMWRNAGLPPLLLSINLSGRQFHEPHIVELIQRVLSETGMPAEQLEVEITESVIMQHVQSTIDNLSALNDMGVKLAIDDFGTGYSSLSYLKRFPLDTLKIDKSFVRDVPLDPDDTAITRAVIAMARTLKLAVIAEGVETREQLDFLQENGCDGVQGYFFSRPLPANELEQLLRENRQLHSPDQLTRRAVRD
jgi:EAL domain-containing protein (putative c-di-GMP-specific phosphodiesterase class I)